MIAIKHNRKILFGHGPKNFALIGTAKINVAKGIDIKILHILEITSSYVSAWYLTSGIITQLSIHAGANVLNTRTKTLSVIGFGEDNEDDDYNEAENINIFDPVPRIIYVSEAFIPNEIFHLNSNGRFYGGSNCYESGNLCLGSSFSGFDMTPVDLLFNSNANTDLPWIGGEIILDAEPFEGIDPNNGSKRHIYKVKKWPTVSHAAQIPKEIKSCLMRL